MHRINHRRKSGPNVFLIVAGFVGVILTGAAAIGVGLFVDQYARASEDANTLLERLQEEYLPGNVFYARDGQLLHQDVTHGEQGEDILRQPVALDDISDHLVDAVISTEDANFYDNPGINVRGLTRAAYENFFPSEEDDVLQGSGGSSITQQLAKLLYFTYEERTTRSIERKNREVFLALAINEKFSKDEILEAYLNTVPLGNLTQGAEAASRVYFGKHASELTLEEAALLAGIPQSPTRYDPYRNYALAKRRQESVLDLMAERTIISRDEAERAKSVDLDAKYNFSCTDCEPDVASLRNSPAPHFVRYAQDELREIVGEEVYNHGGLKVTTSIDLDMHLLAQQITQEWSYEFETTLNPPPTNAAVSGIDPKTGQILFYVGSRNYNDLPIEGENDILRSLQQPGSTMKVFTYLAAFWKGAPDNPSTEGYDEGLAHYKPDTPVLDSPINPPLPGCINPVDPDYAPNNADRSFRGQMTVREALRFSRNVPAVRTISEIGWQAMIDTAHTLGILGLNNEFGYGCAITVGGGDVRPLDLNFAAATLANNGLMTGRPAVSSDQRLTGVATSGDLEIPVGESARQVDPVAILRVEDAHGNVIYSYDQPTTEQVVPAYYSYLITDILRLPTGTLGFSICDQDVAAKTGTQELGDDDANEARSRFSLDTWTMGWSSHLAATVWVGNSDNAPMSRDSFSTNTAGRLFRSIMETFLCGENRLGDPEQIPEPPVPEDYANTPNRQAPPPDTLASNECAELIEQSGYSPQDAGDPSLDGLIGELCGRRGGIGSGDGGDGGGGGGDDCFGSEIIVTPGGVTVIPCENGGDGGGGDGDGGGGGGNGGGGGGGGNNPFPTNPLGPGGPAPGGGGDGNPFN